MPLVVEHGARLGVEPICRALQIAPSAYWRELHVGASRHCARAGASATRS
jgi:hypothetical protein